MRHHERDEGGYPVYTEKAAASTQTKQILYHLWKNYAPSGIVGLQGERLLRAAAENDPAVRGAFEAVTNYDRDLNVKDEVLGALGSRFTTIDVAHALTREAADYSKDREEAKALYNR